MKKRAVWLTAFVSVYFFSAPTYSDVIGVDFIPGSTGWTTVSSDNWTLGYEFSVTSTTQVSGLGFWDVGNGFGDTTVGLWDTSGNLLGMVNSSTSSVITNATANGLGTWNFMDFSYTLTSGNYVVGSWGVGMEYAFNSSGSAITTNILDFVTWREQSGGIFQYPTTVVNYGSGFEGFWGGNIRFATTQVPEPSTITIIGLGLIGIAARRRGKVIKLN